MRKSEFLTVSEVAEALRLSPARTYRLLAEGRLPHVRRGRRLFVPAEAWRRWIAAESDKALAAVAEGQ